jgi:hypothetical protein
MAGAIGRIHGRTARLVQFEEYLTILHGFDRISLCVRPESPRRRAVEASNIDELSMKLAVALHL